MKYFYFSRGAMFDELNNTFAIPFEHGPPAALARVGADPASTLSRLPGLRIVRHSAIAPGPDPSTYAFVKLTEHRNLYRIPLP